MKRCGKCRTMKPKSEFHRSRRRGLQAWCKPCRKAYDAAYWRRNRDRRRLQKRQNIADFRAWYASLKAGRPCTDCGAVLAPAAMQWDHLPGCEKVDALGNLVHRHNRRRTSWPRSPSVRWSVRTVMPCVHLRDTGRSSAWSERCVWDAEVSPVRIRPPRSVLFASQVGSRGTS